MSQSSNLIPSVFSQQNIATTTNTAAHLQLDLKMAGNPLIASSATLWMLITELQEQLIAPDLKQLHATFCQHITLFENKIQTLGYGHTTILATNYFLCALIDENISKTNFGKHGEWLPYSLLKTFHSERGEEDHFFTILSRISEDSKLHIELLEFAYVCLNFGYQGKFNQEPKILSYIIDQLYELIHELRGDVSKHLFLGPSIPPSTKKRRNFLPPWWISMILSLLVLTIIYLPYHYRLKKLSEPIEHVITRFSGEINSHE